MIGEPLASLHLGTVSNIKMALMQLFCFNNFHEYFIDLYAKHKKAFLEAWEAVCGPISNAPVLYIPAGSTFLLKPVTFNGPCTFPFINVLVISLAINLIINPFLDSRASFLFFIYLFIFFIEIIYK